jgi:hypothetical protein
MIWKAHRITKRVYINPKNKQDLNIVTLHSVKFNNVKNLICEENNADEKIYILIIEKNNGKMENLKDS